MSVVLDDRAMGDLARARTQTQIERALNRSTWFSWFWALLFGPLYFLMHGFPARAAVLIILDVLLVGILVAPFMAYPAWRSRASDEARTLLRTGRLGAY